MKYPSPCRRAALARLTIDVVAGAYGGALAGRRVHGIFFRRRPDVAIGGRERQIDHQALVEIGHEDIQTIDLLQATKHLSHAVRLLANGFDVLELAFVEALYREELRIDQAACEAIVHFVCQPERTLIAGLAAA